MEEKFERERKQLAESYGRLRSTLEETEKERYEFELERFKKDQGKHLDGKRTEIDRLKGEKRKVQ